MCKRFIGGFGEIKKRIHEKASRTFKPALNSDTLKKQGNEKDSVRKSLQLQLSCEKV